MPFPDERAIAIQDNGAAGHGCTGAAMPAWISVGAQDHPNHGALYRMLIKSPLLVRGLLPLAWH
jgi:hypothetical protein